MGKTTQDFEELKQIYTMLSQGIQYSKQKNQIQKNIYMDFVKIFHLFSKDLGDLSSRINQQILTSEANNQYVNNTYQFLSNSLLRMGQCSRKVAYKCQNQILQPMKLFSENNFRLGSQLTKMLGTRIDNLRLHYQQLQKQRENYRLWNGKLQKQKEQQKKVMIKIQTSNQQHLEQLNKFNQSSKKILDTISSYEKFYIGAVQKTNYEWIETKQELKKISTSLNHNQQSRQQFCRKTALNCIKTLDQFENAVDTTIQKKIQQSNKNLQTQKTEDQEQKKQKLKIGFMINSSTKQSFISYDDQMKKIRKESLQAEQSHLFEFFNKIKQSDRQILKNMMDIWFQSKTKSNNIKQGEKQKSNVINNEYQKNLQVCKAKILSQQPYSFYFIELLYFKIYQMNSIYCKLQDESFSFIQNAFLQIINNLQLDSKNSLLHTQFLYKILLVSQRIMKKRSIISMKSSKSQPIQLICHSLGKNVDKLNQSRVLMKLYNFILKKRQDKKRQQSGKGYINSITKGFFAVVTRKKQPILTDEQQFLCIQQLVNIIANLSISTQVSIPFLKEVIGSQNKKSFQYLKSLILVKKDISQRQKIFYKTEVKEKMEKKMQKMIKQKTVGPYCVWLAAKKGYLGIQSIQLRLVCKNTSRIHAQILHHLKMPSSVKWPKIIPFNRKLNYQQLFQSVSKLDRNQIDQIIQLDVSRSLHMHVDYLKPEILTNILRVYAHTNKQISYCQGMNYIAGYLFIKTKNQQAGYRLFEYLMEVRFKQLFANQFQVLKIKMYQFQRLLAIYHPQISEHFKRQSILPECYIISWIITLFASSYQYTIQSYLIDILWQRFIIYGWRQFYKFVLWIFSLFKEEIIQMTYDKALHFFGQLVKDTMFLSNKQSYLKQHGNKGDVQQGMERYHVTNELLQNLLKQYHLT